MYVKWFYCIIFANDFCALITLTEKKRGCCPLSCVKEVYTKTCLTYLYIPGRYYLPIYWL